MSFPLLIEPDFAGAIVNYLRTWEALTVDLAPITIKSRRPSFETPEEGQPQNWVSIIKEPGQEHEYVPIRYPRIGVFAYGTSALNSFRLMRVVSAILDPPAGPFGFQIEVHGETTTVLDCKREATPRSLDDEGWPCHYAPFRLTLKGVID